MRTKSTIVVMAVLASAVAAGTAFTQSTSPQPDRIEEDWKLVIASPDLDLNGPQITTCMNPGGGTSTPVVLFNMNYQDHPEFQAGGLQVKVWQDDHVVTASSQGTARCQTDNESITWTQRMSLSGGNVNYKIVSGQSTTWGQFGQGDNDLALSFASSVASLSGYSPDDSAARSAVCFESNHVTSMTLLQVRYYQGSTLLSTDTNPRSVDLLK